MSVTFRPATADDTEAAVPLLYNSGPDVFDYVFAHPRRGGALDFLRGAFPDGAGEFGHRNHTVAVLDGRIVGIGAAFGARQAYRAALGTGRQILGFYGVRHVAEITRRGLRLERVLEAPKGPMHYISHLAVAPDWRGHGIGSRLVEYFLAQGTTLGRTVAALDVSVANPRAQDLYERLGFVVTHEQVSALSNPYGAVPTHRRMERPI
jgi:ribosomal protein S18 acetylase RimI-like enzyme